jgi:CHASE2 domain-containing sensor protein/signal transduction histidine kinase
MPNRLLLEWLLVVLLAIGAASLLMGYRVTERTDHLLYDLFMRAQPGLPSDITIVAIDETSLRALGQWPWSRERHAELLDRLRSARPAAIGYDVLFVEPSAQDGMLGKAIAAAGTVVLPTAFNVPGDNGAPFAEQRPVPPIGHAAAALGHAQLAPDHDGIVRRVWLRAGTAAASRAAFAEQIHRVAKGRPSRAFAVAARDALPDHDFGFSRPLLFSFAGPAGTHPTVSFVSVLRGEIPAELLRGRIVLVGMTALGSGDQYPVPLGPMSGVEVEANIVDTLVANRGITQASPSVVSAFTLLPLAMLLVSILLLAPRANLILGLGLMGGVVATSGVVLVVGRVWLPPTAALAGILIVYPLWAWRRLEAANAYMTQELSHLRAEFGALPVRDEVAPLPRYHEAIARQTALLHLAIARVRDLRRFFSDSLQSLPDATWILDSDGRVLVCNRVAEALLEELRAGPAGEGSGLTLAALLARLAPATASEDDRTEGEITLQDGRTLVLRRAPLVDAAGTCVGSIVRLSDITAIRVAVRQREEALQLLTHDMRSPQVAILALLEQASQADDVGLLPRVGAYARRTLKLADDFVQLARAESRQPDDALLDLSSLLIEAADDQWPLANRKRIRVETPHDEQEYLVRGDRSLLFRMLCNLVGNAIKYSPAGTVVRCTIDRDRVGAHDVIRCRIADQGPGIPREDIGEIFRPFRRSSRATGSGAGLGLAFVHTVATRSGGTVEVSSEPGQGSVFTVQLPAGTDD